MHFFNDKATGRVTVEGIDGQSEVEHAGNADVKAPSRRNMTQEQSLRIRPNVGSGEVVFADGGNGYLASQWERQP